jgi:hypothetical protein
VFIVFVSFVALLQIVIEKWEESWDTLLKSHLFIWNNNALHVERSSNATNHKALEFEETIFHFEGITKQQFEFIGIFVQ